ncbi:SigE family RNA polymerase sigma factor [Nocardioides speluncae]|uniref:SigE family RNA polymerase sigma factor n=1 Tax=Nocardioides speluncae TaxID=2670337 RepID=UPI000D6908DF|nr:SigE family RNA polymerase sigma factor [Nocardioides speluncae]
MRDEREAFSAWARERQLGLLRTAYLLTGDHQRAEDLVQEALTKVALRWRRLADSNPDGYARRVLVNDNISWWRRRRDEVPLENADRATDGPLETEYAERRLLLLAALARLTPRQRAVVVLRYYDDLTVDATAEALGVSAGTVKSQTNLALRRLREAAPELAELLKEER